MNKIKVISAALIIMLGAGTVTLTNAATTNPLIPPTTRNIAAKAAAVQTVPQKTYVYAEPVDMVNYPGKYLNKNVKFKAKFDKYATLGLDYKPAFRSSDKYITFLIQRSDVTTHNVPLSELKIFLDRKEAEKHIDLESGDQIEVAGHVFSNALGDVWMDAEQFTVLTKKPASASKDTLQQ